MSWCQLPALSQGSEADAHICARFPPKGLRRWNAANRDSRSNASIAPGINKWGGAEAVHSSFFLKVKRKRPFVIEADRLQERFGNDFGEYIRSSEAIDLTGHQHSRSCALGIEVPRIVNAASVPQAAQSALEQTPRNRNAEVIKTLHLGPKIDKSHRFVRCTGYGGVTAASSWVACDFEDKWQSINIHRTCDITNSSVKSAMSMSPSYAEEKLLQTSYRSIGLAERSLQDRSPRTNPDCIRPPLPSIVSPRLVERAQQRNASTLASPSYQIGGFASQVVLEELVIGFEPDPQKRLLSIRPNMAT